MPFPVFAKQEDVPESFRGEYEEREGRWHPKVPDVGKLQSALESERAKVAEEERKRKAAEDLSAKLKRDVEAKDKNIPESEIERLRKEDEEKRKPITEENERLKAENQKLKLDDRVRALALKNGVMNDRIDDAMAVLTPRVSLTESGNEIVVKDKDRKVTTEKVEDFLAKTFKAEKPWFYAGSGSSGGGEGGSGGGGGGGGGNGKENDPDKIAEDMQKKREARPNPLLDKK